METLKNVPDHKTYEVVQPIFKSLLTVASAVPLFGMMNLVENKDLSTEIEHYGESTQHIIGVTIKGICFDIERKRNG